MQIFFFGHEGRRYNQAQQCKADTWKPSFLIDSEDEMTVSIDGEKGPEMPLSVEVKKGCLKVLVPKNFENRGAEDELQGI